MDVSWPCPVPAHVAWATSIELASWPTWGPSVTAVEPADGVVVAGLTGRVRTPLGAWVPFRVDQVDGHRWTWHVGPIPATGHRVDPVTATTCRLVIEVPMWAAPYAVVCLVALRRLSVLAVDAHTRDEDDN